MIFLPSTWLCKSAGKSPWSVPSDPLPSASRPPRDVDMVMRFETDDGRVYTSQYFESVAEWKIWT